MRFLNVMGAVLVALTLAGEAQAQRRSTASAGYSGRGQGWSVLSGQTVGQGNTAFVGQVGWPGLSASLLHGGTEPKIKYYFELKETLAQGESLEHARARGDSRLQALMDDFLGLARERGQPL